MAEVDEVHGAVLSLADEYWAFHRGTAQLWNVDRGDVGQVEHWEDVGADATRSRVEALHGFVATAGRCR